MDSSLSVPRTGGFTVTDEKAREAPISSISISQPVRLYPSFPLQLVGLILPVISTRLPFARETEMFSAILFQAVAVTKIVSFSSHPVSRLNDCGVQASLMFTTGLPESVFRRIGSVTSCPAMVTLTVFSGMCSSFRIDRKCAHDKVLGFLVLQF